jgi:hypothetical protein
MLVETLRAESNGFLIETPGYCIVQKKKSGYVVTFDHSEFDYTEWAREKFDLRDWRVLTIFEDRIYNVAVSDRVVTYLLTSSE